MARLRQTLCAHCAHHSSNCTFSVRIELIISQAEMSCVINH